MKVISLFSGCGGLDLGFKKAGFNIVWANDIDKDACQTYENNIGKHIIHQDIKDVNLKSIPDADIVIGGFPCLGFTIAKGSKRTINDKHNMLYKEYLRVVEEKKPTLFLIENVVGIKSGKEFEDFFHKMLKEFQSLGYTITYQTMLASDYGVPQMRKRVIIIGTKNQLQKQFKFPVKLMEKPLSLKDAIIDLPVTEDIKIPNHIALKHKVKVNQYVGNRILSWDKPSPTITGRGSRTGGAVIHPHPSLTRRLTVRECARIQSFPDDFIFAGSISACFAHIGNAVPPVLSYFIALQVLSFFGKTSVKNNFPFDLPYKNHIDNITQFKRCR